MGTVNPPEALIVMGVAGSGKSTVGQQLAAELGWQFNDADGFHPPENVAKMSAGIPLTDGDRAPWLSAIREHLGACLARGQGVVVTCSALKETYRSVIRVDPERVKLVYLQGSRDLLWERITSRKDHFMKPSMLDSQLATLEEPIDALTLDIAADTKSLVAAIRHAYSL